MKLKIIFILWDDTAGGSEKFVINTAIDLKNTFDIQIAFIGKLKRENGKYIKKTLEKSGIPYISFGATNGYSLIKLLKFFYYLKNSNIDIVHFHSLSPLFMCVAFFLKSIKFIYTEHTGIIYSIRHRLFYRIFRNKFYYFILYRKYKNFLKPYGINDSRIFIVPNAVDSNFFYRDNNKYKTLTNLLDLYNPLISSKINVSKIFSTKILAYIGRLSQEKNFSYILKIMEYIHQINTDIIFFIVGSGKERPLLDVSMQKLPIVYFSYVYDMRKIYSVIDLVLLSSKFEGLPTVIMEAALMHVPAVVSACNGGIKNLIINNKTGIIKDEIKKDRTRKPDIKGMAMDILMILSSENKLEAFGNAAEKYIKKNYDISNVINKLKQIYESI